MKLSAPNEKQGEVKIRIVKVYSSVAPGLSSFIFQFLNKEWCPFALFGYNMLCKLHGHANMVVIQVFSGLYILSTVHLHLGTSFVFPILRMKE